MERFTISRHWDNPTIHHTIDNRRISISVDMEDFKKAVVKEFVTLMRFHLKEQLQKSIGSVTWVFRNDTFSTVLSDAIEKAIPVVEEYNRQAVDVAVKKVKEESKKAV